MKDMQELCKINLTLLSSAIFLYKRCIIHSFLIVICNNYIKGLMINDNVKGNDIILQSVNRWALIVNMAITYI